MKEKYKEEEERGLESRMRGLSLSLACDPPSSHSHGGEMQPLSTARCASAPDGTNIQQRSSTRAQHQLGLGTSSIDASKNAGLGVQEGKSNQHQRPATTIAHELGLGNGSVDATKSAGVGSQEGTRDLNHHPATTGAHQLARLGNLDVSRSAGTGQATTTAHTSSVLRVTLGAHATNEKGSAFGYPVHTIPPAPCGKENRTPGMQRPSSKV